MIRILILSLVLSALPVASQEVLSVDAIVQRYPNFTTVEALGYRIMNDFSSDSTRVRAAFAWLAHHIIYDTSVGTLFKAREYIRYSTEAERQKLVARFAGGRADLAFRMRRGVCIDYSLLLHGLCTQFGLNSMIVSGVGKTEILDYRGEPLYKNHSWNAVRIDGAWKLMDVTWAAGYMDADSKRFVHAFVDHYFFTDPADFVKHHLPSKPEWQLLSRPLDAKTFFAAPIFLPDYFDKGIDLSLETGGIVKASDKDGHYLFFNRLPRDHAMTYSVNGSSKRLRLGFRRESGQAYVSRIKLQKRLLRNHESLTVYMEEHPILNFRIAR